MNTIDAKLLARMFLAGAKNLEVKKEWINELNVFPVPDGDTGTNMTLTIMSAVKEVNGLEDVQMTTLAKAISSGSLRGARGNSGVILSQLLRGFTKGIRDLKELDAVALARAVDKGVETAYKAVMKPKEGTIHWSWPRMRKIYRPSWRMYWKKDAECLPKLRICCRY